MTFSTVVEVNVIRVSHITVVVASIASRRIDAAVVGVLWSLTRTCRVPFKRSHVKMPPAIRATIAVTLRFRSNFHLIRKYPDVAVGSFLHVRISLIYDTGFSAAVTLHFDNNSHFRVDRQRHVIIVSRRNQIVGY